MIATPPPPRKETSRLVYQSAAGDVEVEDPFSWLEETSEEREKWIHQETSITEQYLGAGDAKQRLNDLVTDLWKFEMVGLPIVGPNRTVYYTYNSGLRNQHAIYSFPECELNLFKDAKMPMGQVFFDVNDLSKDGKTILSTHSFSPDGGHWAYAESRMGSDWLRIKVIRVKDMEALADEVYWVKFTDSITWTPDSKGFFYQTFPHSHDMHDPGTSPESTWKAQICYHAIGSPQSLDELVYEEPDTPGNFFKVSIVGDKALLSIKRVWGDEEQIKVATVGRRSSYALGAVEWDWLVPEWGAGFQFLHQDGDTIYVRTSRDAPNFKIASYDVERPMILKDMVPNRDDGVLSRAMVTSSKQLVLLYSIDLEDVIFIYDLKGNLRKRVGLSILGVVKDMSVAADSLLLSTSNLLSSERMTSLSLKSESLGEISHFRDAAVDHGSNGYVMGRVMCESSDSTKVPIVLMHHSSTKLDGTAPLFLYGYGGFNQPLRPKFNPGWMAFAKHFGGVVAAVHLRGGNEFGEQWHQLGIHERKQNVFDDFLAAARHLADMKYTSPGRIILNGCSNGGLLVAACTNQAEEGLLGCSLVDVGVLDMLKYHQWTSGRLWVGDLGSADSPEGFDYISKYSPLHNLDKEKQYPPMLLATADHDDRVAPCHTYKFMAACRHQLPSTGKPVLLRVSRGSGHSTQYGEMIPTQLAIELFVDKLTFAALSMRLALVE